MPPPPPPHTHTHTHTQPPASPSPPSPLRVHHLHAARTSSCELAHVDTCPRVTRYSLRSAGTCARLGDAGSKRATSTRAHRARGRTTSSPSSPTTSERSQPNDCGGGTQTCSRTRLRVFHQRLRSKCAECFVHLWALRFALQRCSHTSVCSSTCPLLAYPST
jgi:hypothetical protein